MTRKFVISNIDNLYSTAEYYTVKLMGEDSENPGILTILTITMEKPQFMNLLSVLMGKKRKMTFGPSVTGDYIELYREESRKELEPDTREIIPYMGAFNHCLEIEDSVKLIANTIKCYGTLRHQIRDQVDFRIEDVGGKKTLSPILRADFDGYDGFFIVADRIVEPAIKVEFVAG